MSEDRCRVRVCRDCCCGTERKHPQVDHDGLLARLTERVADRAEVDVTGCLLACEGSNVVVVSPSAAGRRAGARTVWFTRVLDERCVDVIAGWVRRGGPGRAAVPPQLAGHRRAAPPAAALLALESDSRG
jgi:(2Fe-2S) ferredoxin